MASRSALVTRKQVNQLLVTIATVAGGVFVLRGYFASAHEDISRLQDQVQHDRELYEAKLLAAEAKLLAAVEQAKRETGDRFIQLGFIAEHEAYQKRLSLQTGRAESHTTEEDT